MGDPALANGAHRFRKLSGIDRHDMLPVQVVANAAEPAHQQRMPEQIGIKHDGVPAGIGEVEAHASA